MPDLPPLTLASLKAAAGEYALLISATPIPELYGVSDGKAVGTHVEAAFNAYVLQHFRYHEGNAAKGIDFPGLDVDLKVTSIRQPQSSCPFRDATQKVYGLGYHLIVFVYEKADDAQLNAARLEIRHVVFLDRTATGDFQTTTGIRKILENDGNADDIDGFLEERNLPLDEIGRRQLAERIIEDPPVIGCLTISNALQWRLQYNRAIQLASGGVTPGVEDLRV
jgi:restriction system protein